MSTQPAGASRQEAKHFVVVLHDIAPESHEAADQFLKDLASAGTPCASLFVTPREHRKHKGSEKCPFMAWLTHMKDQNYDICLNGFEHVAVMEPMPKTQGIGALFGLGAEQHNKYCISEQQALDKLAQGVAFFRNGGIPVNGLNAPAWRLTEPIRQAVLAQGIRCNMTHQHIELIECKHRIKAPALATTPAWANRPGRQRAAIKLWQLANRHTPVLRVIARTSDIENPTSRALLFETVQALSRTRSASTCREMTHAFETHGG